MAPTMTTNEIQTRAERSRANLDRMKTMDLTDQEANYLAGYLAGCTEMGSALDRVEVFRMEPAAPAEAA